MADMLLLRCNFQRHTHSRKFHTCFTTKPCPNHHQQAVLAKPSKKQKAHIHGQPTVKKRHWVLGVVQQWQAKQTQAVGTAEKVKHMGSRQRQWASFSASPASHAQTITTKLNTS
eukprot:1160742-Pelagomonas_calceolata.AAC.5